MHVRADITTMLRSYERGGGERASSTMLVSYEIILRPKFDTEIAEIGYGRGLLIPVTRSTEIEKVRVSFQS